jgi:hypothetical protein
MQKKEKVLISGRVPRDLAATLKKLANREQRSASQMLSLILQEGVSNRQKILS